MKDQVAEQLAQAHYRLEPTVTLVRQLVGTAAEEADPREPVKLLEVNEPTIAAGIRPLYFGPSPASGIVYPSIIVEVTPGEYDEILRDPSRLPSGWRLGRVYERDQAAVG